VPANVRVTNDAGGHYLRADGGTDSVMDACGNGRREQNEPTVGVDPHDPRVVVAGANDYCSTVATGETWLGYYRSTDQGRTWHDSLVPGYPSDDSAAGRASPTMKLCQSGSDPSASFDREGRLFYGFICFQRVGRFGQKGFANSSTFVASYDQDGGHYGRTILVGKGSRSADEDKINLAVDQTAGPHSGNVYTAWVELAPPAPGGFPQDLLRFSRSTDHGRTFSKPQPLSDLHHATNPDIAVGPDGTVFVTFDAGGGIFVARSTDGGKTFEVPSEADTLAFPLESSDFSGGSGRDCGDGSFKCNTGLTFSRFSSFPTIAADQTGVHVAWSDRLLSGRNGQSKIYVRTSTDGVSWPGTAVQIDDAPKGHQYYPDLASSNGTITLVFYDSRNDPAYDPLGPPGETKDGKSPGGAVDTYVAQSRDGGTSWSERRVSSLSSNYNLEVPGPVPFWGDYIYVSAVGGTVMVVWTDSRAVVLADHGTGGADGFDPFEPCFNTRAFANDPCLSKGGHDQNIYAARI